MKLFACCPVMLLADCPIKEKAPSTSHTYTYTYTHTYSDIAGQTLSNACFDRLLRLGGGILFARSSCCQHANGS